MGHSRYEIAQLVEMHRSTINRELHWNTGKHGYRPKLAHEKASGRRAKAKPRITATTNEALLLSTGGSRPGATNASQNLPEVALKAMMNEDPDRRWVQIENSPVKNRREMGCQREKVNLAACS
jgi:hypothetical protein